MKNLELFANFLESYLNDAYFVESAYNLYNLFSNAEIIGNSDIIEIIEEAKECGIDDIENIIRDDYLFDHYEEEIGDMVIEKVEDIWGVGHDTYLVKKLYENRYNINGLNVIGIVDDFEEAENDIVNSEVEGLSKVVEQVVEEVENVEDIRAAYEYVLDHKRKFFEALGSLEFDMYYKNCVMMGTADDSLENITNEVKEFISRICSY